jgi:hypothetical protein
MTSTTGGVPAVADAADHVTPGRTPAINTTVARPATLARTRFAFNVTPPTAVRHTCVT